MKKNKTISLIVSFLIIANISYSETQKVGLLNFDGDHGNIYTGDITGHTTGNIVGTKQAPGHGGIYGSNIAFGSGNVAGVELDPIETEVEVNGVKKKIITGYKRKRMPNGFRIPTWDTKDNEGAYATAIGFVNAAYGVGAFAIGRYNVAGAEASFAGGHSSIASSAQAFAFGKEVKAMGKQSVAFGKKSEAWGENAFAIGDETKAKGENAIAMGRRAEAIGGSSFALGEDSKASKYSSFAFGNTAKAEGRYSMSLGHYSKSEGEYSTALGTGSTSKGNWSTTIGGGTVEENAERGISLGVFSKTITKNGVSLGSNSLADRNENVYGYNILGGKEFDNEILGKFLNKETEINEYNKQIEEKKPELQKAKEEFEKAEADYEGMLRGTNNIEFTTENMKKLTDEIKIKKAKFNEVNVEMLELQKNKNLITGAFLSSQSAVSIGNSETGMTRQLTGLAAGTKPTDAVNVAQLKQILDLNPFEYVLDDKDNTKVYKMGDSFYKLNGDKYEKITDTSNVVIKSKNNLRLLGIKSSLTENSGNTTANTNPSTPKPQPNIDDKKGSVVVVEDLKKLENGIDSNKDSITKIENNINTITNNISEIKKNIQKIDEKFNLAISGVSNAIAMSNLPQVSGKNKFNLSASYGYYCASHSVAVGFSGRSDNGKFIYKLSGSINSSGNVAFGVGAGLMFGKITEEDQSSEIEKLKKENQEIKELLNKLLNIFKSFQNFTFSGTNIS